MWGYRTQSIAFTQLMLVDQAAYKYNKQKEGSKKLSQKEKERYSRELDKFTNGNPEVIDLSKYNI